MALKKWTCWRKVPAFLLAIMVAEGLSGLFLEMSLAVESRSHDQSVEIQNQKRNQSQKDLSTNLNFEDLLVQGTYHFSDEAVATVEDDKVLDSLLVIRKDFKDRIKRSASRH